MKHETTNETPTAREFWFALGSVAVVSTIVFVLGFLRISSLQSDLASTTAALYGKTGLITNDLASLHSQTDGISKVLTSAQQDILSANNNISAVKDQVGGVVQTVGNISGSVTTLQKLVTIDPELLKKYSKVFFLNENYAPAHITMIPQLYIYSNTRQEKIMSEAWPFLQQMLDAAKASGISLYVKSAYRSFAEQQTLKNEYTVVYGAGTANSFSADQGYSEHQLGTAVDFITSGLDGVLSNAFDSTAAFSWLKANAYRFGFELSYPKGNSYYVYEPWHWRFVGIKLSTVLHNNNTNFYDVDQRDIDTYLANLFDAQ